MISDRARELLSEGVSEDEERTVIFLEKGDESLVFRLFRAREGDEDPEEQATRWLERAREGDEDPEEQATRWLERARSLCRSAHGNLRTGIVRSRNGERFMVAVSGREIEAKEWPPEFDDSSPLSAGQTAR